MLYPAGFSEFHTPILVSSYFCLLSQLLMQRLVSEFYHMLEKFCLVLNIIILKEPSPRSCLNSNLAIFESIEINILSNS